MATELSLYQPTGSLNRQSHPLPIGVPARAIPLVFGSVLETCKAKRCVGTRGRQCGSSLFAAWEMEWGGSSRAPRAHSYSSLASQEDPPLCPLSLGISTLPGLGPPMNRRTEQPWMGDRAVLTHRSWATWACGAALFPSQRGPFKQATRRYLPGSPSLPGRDARLASAPEGPVAARMCHQVPWMPSQKWWCRGKLGA